jgi:hypothetical protein
MTKDLCVRVATVGLMVSGGLSVAMPTIATAHHGREAQNVASRPTAFPSRTQSVKETVHAGLVSHHGNSSINERGSGSGTYRCAPLTVQISVYGDTEAVIAFTCSTHSGSLSGRGTVAYAASGKVAIFKGTLRLTHGTGAFSHASSAGLRIQGTLARHSYALSASVTGAIRL